MGLVLPINKHEAKCSLEFANSEMALADSLFYPPTTTLTIEQCKKNILRT